MIGFRMEYNQAQFKRLEKKLTDFERKQVLSQTVQEVGAFMLDKVREYPPYKTVSRRAAYGVTFFTSRQRRWFFAALADGTIHPWQDNRTGKLREGWKVVERGPKQVDMVNEVAYAKFVQGTVTEQARQPRLVGWWSVTRWLREFKSEIGRVGMSNIKKWANS
jgi:hypothetical protein